MTEKHWMGIEPKIKKCDDTYVLAVQSNPVGYCQSIDKHSEESLVVGICDAHEVRFILYAHLQSSVPAHVARHNLVTASPVLNIIREREAIGVGGRFACI